jgi:hypothetical protein
MDSNKSCETPAKIPDIEKLRQESLNSQQQIQARQLGLEQKLAEDKIRMNSPEEKLKRDNDIKNVNKKLYENVISYIKRRITLSASNGLRKEIIKINPAIKWGCLLYTTTDPPFLTNIPSYYNLYPSNMCIFINKQILTEVVNNLRKEHYIVKYLSIFYNMKGISIEW